MTKVRHPKRKPPPPKKMGRPRERALAAAFDRAVGARIKARRVDVAISVEFLAATINRSPAQVSRYQSGDTPCGVETLLRIADALDTTLSYLAEGK